MKKRFDDNPERFIKEAIQKYALESSANRLATFGGERIFAEPLIGFADGDDPPFDE